MSSSVSQPNPCRNVAIVCGSLWGALNLTDPIFQTERILWASEQYRWIDRMRDTECKQILPTEMSVPSFSMPICIMQYACITGIVESLTSNTSGMLSTATARMKVINFKNMNKAWVGLQYMLWSFGVEHRAYITTWPKITDSQLHQQHTLQCPCTHSPHRPGSPHLQR